MVLLHHKQCFVEYQNQYKLNIKTHCFLSHHVFDEKVTCIICSVRIYSPELPAFSTRGNNQNLLPILQRKQSFCMEGKKTETFISEM